MVKLIIMNPNNKKIQKNNFLWSLLLIFIVITTFANIIILFTNFDGLMFLDVIINSFMVYLISIRSKLGVVLITFALIVGIFGSYDKNAIMTLIIQIALIIVTIPLWIEKFSNWWLTFKVNLKHRSPTSVWFPLLNKAIYFPTLLTITLSQQLLL